MTGSRSPGGPTATFGVALAEQSALVAGEVLATSTNRVDDVAELDGGRVFRDDDLGLAFTVSRA